MALQEPLSLGVIFVVRERGRKVINWTVIKRPAHLHAVSISCIIVTMYVVKAMCEQDGMTDEIILDAWKMVNEMTSGANGKHLDTEAVSARAKNFMGFGLPYNTSFAHVHSKVELDIVRRKIHVNAIYFDFFIICVAIERLGKFTTDEIHRIFLCADLLQAEVEGGCNSYENIAAELVERGIYVVRDGGSARLGMNNVGGDADRHRKRN